MQGGKGGPVHSLSANCNTGYPQVMPLFRSDKRTIRALERLEDRFDALTTQTNELESANKRLQLEWVETYDKVRHQLSRMARRGDLPKSNGAEEIVDETPPGGPKMDPISAKIHARRNRSFLKEE